MWVFFKRILRPYILDNKYKNICEIGAAVGRSTDKLLDIGYVAVSIIDPCLEEDLEFKYKKIERVRVYRGLSLQVLPKMFEGFDCILIDGDHNWYTVFGELKYIEENELIKEGGTIFLHDVAGPFGRRDMYYIPESIPPTFRHPFDKKGIATIEGGLKNGVLTAVEDFLKLHKKKYMFFMIKPQHGLGMLVKKKNLKSKLIFLKWFIIIKFYGINAEVTELIRRKMPRAYQLATRVAKKFNIDLWV